MTSIVHGVWCRAPCRGLGATTPGTRTTASTSWTTSQEILIHKKVNKYSPFHNSRKGGYRGGGKGAVAPTPP